MTRYGGFIFDLDGTLYDTKALDEANEIAIRNAISESLGIPLEDADKSLEEHLDRDQTGGKRSSLFAAAISLGVKDTLIEKWQIRKIHPENVIVEDKELFDLLFGLSERAKIALLTNTRTNIAKRALSALGITHSLFTVIRGGDLLHEPKPSPKDLQDIADIFALVPSDCISVGDRWDVDLDPAQQLGMAVQLVSGRDELCSKLRDWLR